MCSDRDSVIFLKPIFCFTYLFGITPKYDFEHRRIISERFRLQVIVFALISLVILQVFCVYYRCIALQSSEVQSFIFLYVCNAISGYFSVLFMVLNSHIKKDEWGELLNRLLALENRNNLSIIKNLEKGWFKRPVIQFWITLIFSCALQLYSVLVWNSNNYFMVSVICRLIYFFYNVIMLSMVCNFALALRKKFRHLNKKLEETKSYKMLRQCRLMYNEALCILTLINRIFGPSLLCSYFLFGTQAATGLALMLLRQHSLRGLPHNFVLVITLQLYGVSQLVSNNMIDESFFQALKLCIQQEVDEYCYT